MRPLLPLLAFVAASPGLAHDFWIRPSRHRAASGDVIRVHLKVGEHLKGDPVRRNPARMESFTAVGPGGEVPLPGLDGTDPAGLFKAAGPGAYTFVYRGRPSNLELPAAKFEAYLREEGLESVLEARRAAGESGRPGRERFVRCAKALVKIGDGAMGGFEGPVHLRLELIPEADPMLPAETRELPLRVVFEGRPLAHAKLVAQCEGDPGREIAARSDAEGRVRLRLDRPGRWMVKTVHMVRLTGVPDADWESLWASLSFEAAGAAPTP